MNKFSLFERKTFFSISVLVLLLTSVAYYIDNDDNDDVVASSDPGYKSTHLNQLPVYFEKNMGQVDKSIGFYARNNRYSIQLNQTGFVTTLNKANERIEATFVDANKNTSLVGANKLAGTINYLIGSDKTKWQTNIPIYSHVEEKNIYPGISLRYYSSRDRLEYDFIVSPNANADEIQISFTGADRLSIDENGNLVLKTSQGELRHKKPIVYQDINGERIDVEGRYTLYPSPFTLNEQTTAVRLPAVGFTIDPYNKNHPLIIDPIVDYASYFGGELEDKGLAIAVDDTGSVYLAGTTQSSLLPVSNAYQSALNGTRDTFVAKLSSSGDSLVYATYFGGSGDEGSSDDDDADDDVGEDDGDDNDEGDSDNETGIDITVDSSGNVYIVSTTDSSTDFPITNAYQSTYGGGASDAYVAKLSADGSSLLFSTYLGGSGKDKGFGIALDSTGNATVTGMTTSDDFPVQNAVQATLSGAKDAFISKLTSDGGALSWSTYLGGSKADVAKAIALDSSDNIYVTGVTKSKNDFPLVNAQQASYGGGGRDAFVSKLSADGSTLAYSTYLGGAKKDKAHGIAVDSLGQATVVGVTKSKTDFPTISALQSTYGGGADDGFIAQLSADGSTLNFATYYGGDKTDKLNNIAIDNSDNLYIVGTTQSSTGITLVDAVQSELNGSNRDAVIGKISNDGSTVLFSSYYGGSLKDTGRDIAVDDDGSLYIAGITRSDSDFPVENAYQSLFGGEKDAFVLKLAEESSNTAPEITSTLTTTAYVGDTYTDTVIATDAEGDTLSYSLTTSPSGMTIDSSTGEISWTPTAQGSEVITVTVSDGNGGSDSQSATITVPNRAPEITSSLITSAEVGVEYSDTVTATDPDSDTLTYSLSVFPSGMTIDSSTAEINWTPTSAGDKPVSLSVSDGNGGSDSQSATITVTAANTAPTITSTPGTSASVGETYSYQIEASDDDGDTLTYSLTTAPSDMTIDSSSGEITWTPTSAGDNTVSLSVSDGNGGSASQSYTLSVSTITISSSPISVAYIDVSYYYQIDASDSDDDALSYSLTTAPSGMSIDSDGLISWTPDTEGDNSVSITVSDTSGDSTTQSYTLSVSEITVPEDPSSSATALSTTAITSFVDSTAFLYEGDNAVQFGMDPNTIEAERVTVIRGNITDTSGNALSGVTITVHDNDDYGFALSRSDGQFDLVANGGGWLTLHYEKDGYLPVQRRVNAPWRDYVHIDAVVMTSLDTQVTTIDLSSSTAYQVAQGSIESDDDGSRQATILFPAGTTATMTLSDGSTQTLTTLNVRATEYTVGTTGPDAMPGPLPASSGYTYAVNLSVDEALAVDASRVDFDQTLPVYIDNFLGFPTGEVVPLGYYDFDQAAWIGSTNGRIVEVLRIESGAAVLDVTGAGTDATDTELADVGIDSDELTQLASLYTAGDSLWRVPITHFTPWDCNWPYGPPEDAEEPPTEEPTGGDEDDLDPEDENECDGCVISAQSQTLGEDVPIVGTPFRLHYRSDRVKGRDNRTLTIPLSEDTIPDSLQRIDLTIAIAGQSIEQSFDPVANLSTTWIWDGLDAYGREITGAAEATITIDYVYNVVYYGASSDFEASFAQFGVSSDDTSSSTLSIIGQRDSQEVTVQKIWIKTLGTFTSDASGLGGWSLSAHHAYDTAGSVIYKGDGDKRSAANLNAVIETVVGDGNSGYDDGGAATDTSVRYPTDVVVAADGSFYIAGSGEARIFKVGTDGIITIVAGNGRAGSSGDGGAATDASLSFPTGVAVAADGSLYIADLGNHRIRKVDADGIITTVAGNGSADFSGDGGAATDASLDYPAGVAVAADGSLYIADRYNHRIRKVDPDGIISTVAGNGSRYYSGDGGAATDTSLYYPYGVAVAADGSLYIADYGNDRIRKVDADGIITTVAGNGSADFSGDGGVATDASLYRPTDVAVAADSSLYIADQVNDRIRKVGTDGIITTIAGNGSSTYSGDGGPATNAGLDYLRGVAVATDGSVYIADYADHRIRRVFKAFPDFAISDYAIVSRNGRQLYRFDSEGQHQETVDTTTSASLYSFSYTDDGTLDTVTDVDGDITTIERNAEGNPTAIIAADGQRTGLALDANGYLAAVTNPNSETTIFTYSDDGLMLTRTDARGNSNTFTYNESGRLLTDTDAVGGGWTISRTDNDDDSYTVSMTSGEGRTRTFTVAPQTDGSRIQTNTAPNGTETTITFETDGTETTTRADGTQIVLEEGPDPRFGMLSPIPETVTTTTPAGLEHVITTSRSVTLDDDDDLFSHSALTETVGINGNTTTSSYDTSTNTWTTTSAVGRTSTQVLDSNGRLSQSTVTGLATTSMSYTTAGRLDTVTEDDGTNTRATTLSYVTSGDAQGFLDSITDPEGRTVSFDYDLAGRITSQTLPDLREINYSYDANGNLASITPPGKPTHSFAYTAMNLESDYTPPTLSGITTPTTVRSYNLDKQLELITRPDGQTLDFVYSATTGQLTSLILPRGTMSYTYSSTSGNLTQITDPDSGTLSYSYDGSLPLSQTLTGDVSGSVSQAYNNNFQISQRSVNSANTVAFSYDNDFLLTQAGDITLTRDTNNGLITATGLLMSGNTVNTARTWNSFAEITAVTADINSSDLYSVSYTRDSIGRITQKTETVNGTSTTLAYTYDTAGRLIEVETDSVSTATYTYDDNSNRTHVNGTLLGTYDDQDRLIAYGDYAYTYTDNGELLNKVDTVASETTTYDYDVLGNLMGVTQADGTVISYVIDGQNRRVGKKVGGTLTQGLLYKDQLNPIAELDSNGDVTSRFVYADKGNVPSYMEKDGTIYRILSDHLGSPRLIINMTDGTITQQMNYDEFGNITTDTNPGFQPFGFAGGLYDSDTGLTRFGARDYDPEVGRWTSKDPILFGGGDVNLYGYTFNDPINFIDPNGKFLFVGATIGFVGGFVGTLATGGSLGDAALNGVIGGVAGFIPGVGSLLGAIAQGALTGAITNSASQIAQIAKDPCKTAKDFNYGSLLGSALGGALTGGRSQPLWNSTTAQLSTALSNTGINATTGVLGTALGQ